MFAVVKLNLKEKNPPLYDHPVTRTQRDPPGVSQLYF